MVANWLPSNSQIALEVGASARMDAGEGISLEFGCQERAQVLTVSAGERAAGRIRQERDGAGASACRLFAGA